VNHNFTNELEFPALPPLGMGCAALGNLYAPLSDGDAQAALEAATAGGVRFFDTAPYYGHGLSETRLGAFLAGQSSRSILSTKVGRSLAHGEPPGETGQQEVHAPGQVGAGRTQHQVEMVRHDHVGVEMPSGSERHLVHG
jgi:aryl-alcohol dehydrogenase-like predicted oxidoreductase